MAVAITRTADPAGVASSGGVTSYTTTAIGTAAVGRFIYVLVGAEVASDPTAATIDIGSGPQPMVAGTLASFGSMRARMFKLRMDWGTSATINITWSAAVLATENHISVYAVTGMGDAEAAAGTNTSTDMDATAPLTTGSITIAANGGFLSIAASATDTTTKTWANATGDLDEDAGVFRYGTASRTTSGTVTVTCTGSTNGEDGALAWVRFDSGNATNLVPLFEAGGAQVPPPSRTSMVERAAAARGSSQFRAFNLLPMGWETQAVQPPQVRSEKAGAIVIGDDGIYKALVAAPPSIAWGFEQHQIALRAQIKRHIPQGAVDPLITFAFRPAGWEVQSWQPPHPRPERSAAIAIGEDGIDGPYSVWRNGGWEVISVQPPHPRREKAGALAFGENGIHATFTLTPPTVYANGWQVDPVYLARPKRTYGGLGGRSQFASFNNPPLAGWEAQIWQPPRRKLASANLLANVEIKPVVTGAALGPWGYDAPAHYKRTFSRINATKGRAHFAIFAPFVQFGWEGAPQHIAPKRARGGAFAGDATAIPTVRAATPWGYETQPFLASRRQRDATLGGQAQLVFRPTTIVWGFEQPPQAQRTPRRVAPLQALSAVDGIYVNWQNTGWESQSGLLVHPRIERGGLFADGRSQFTASELQPFGWHVQAWQPPHPRPERSAAIAPREDGISATFTVWRNAGWEVQAYQPPHPKPERSGALALGDGGIQGVQPFGLQTAAYAWGYDGPYIYPRKAYAVSGAIAPREDGNEAPFSFWRNFGWEVQSHQPPHPRAEKSGSIQIGDAGIQAQFVFAPTTVAWGYDIASFQPRAPRKAQMTGPSQVDAVYSNWLNSGWEVQSFQPPQVRTEKAGSIQFGSDGIDGPFVVTPTSIGWIFDQPQMQRPVRRLEVAVRNETESPFNAWRNAGWEIQPWQPPHRASERKGASILRGDDGTQGRYVNWLNSGWEVHPYQPPHPRPERSAVQFIGDSGIHDTLFVPAPPDPASDQHFLPFFVTVGQLKSM